MGLAAVVWVLLLSICCLSAAQPWPSGAWETNPGEIVTYSFNKADQLVLIYGLVNTDGYSFDAYQVYQPLSAPPGQYLYANFSGSVGCTPRFYLIVSVLASSCVQRGWPGSNFCQLGPDAFGGTYEYSVSKDEDGGPVIIVKNWGGVLWPYRMACKEGASCSSYYNCNATVVTQMFFTINGGEQVISNSYVTLNGSTNVTFTGDQVTVQNSEFNINLPDTTTNIQVTTTESNVTMGDVTNLNIYANNLTSSGCGGSASYQAVQQLNLTIASNSPPSYLYMSSVLPGFAPFSSEWDVYSEIFPIGWQFTGTGPTEYSLQVCVKAARAFYLNQNDTFSLELGLGTNTDPPAQYASGFFTLDSPSSSLLLDSLCVDALVLLNATDTVRVYVGSSSSVTGSWILGPGSTQGGGAGLVITFTAFPSSCEQRPNVNHNNFSLNITFNQTHVDVGCGLEKTFEPSNNSVILASTSIKSLRTNGDPKIQDCEDARLLDTLTLGWSSDGTDITADVLLEFFAIGAGLSVSRSGANVTYTYLELLFKAIGQFLSVSQAGRNVTYSYTGLDTIRGGTDGVWMVGNVTIRVLPGLTLEVVGQDIVIGPNSTTTSNDTSCVNCNNGTLTADRLCSREPQCTVQSEPPTSNPPGPVPQICYTCSPNHNGGGDDDGGGGGAPPVVPPIPPLIPFFPILIPPIVGVPGSGTPGSGLPAVAIPLITNCTNENVPDKGMYLPKVNFSESVPCCDNRTVGWTLLETGSLPQYQFICKRIGDSTYAWVPNAEAGGTSFNTSTYNTQAAWIFNNYSSVAGDNTSQFIWYGPAYYGGQVFMAGTLEMCNASSTLKAGRLETCTPGGNIPIDGNVVQNGNLTNLGVITHLLEVCSTTPAPEKIQLDGAGGCGGGVLPITTDMSVCTSGKVLKMSKFYHCDGTSPVEATSGLTFPGASATTLQAGALLSVAAAGLIKRTSVTATASSTSVTANGQLVEIAVNAGVCVFSAVTPNVCTITITNSAITLATSIARIGITNIALVGPTEIPVCAVTNILAPSLDAIFFVNTYYGPNIPFTFYVELLN